MLKKIVVVALLTVMVVGVFAHEASAAVKPENVAKMTAAMPDKAPAKPAIRRRLF